MPIFSDKQWQFGLANAIQNWQDAKIEVTTDIGVAKARQTKNLLQAVKVTPRLNLAKHTLKSFATGVHSA